MVEPLIHERVSRFNQRLFAAGYDSWMAKLSIWQRIQRVMEVMKWTEKDLRRELGMKPQDVWNWKKRNGTIGFERALQLQTLTLFNARWLMSQEGPERMTALTEEEQRFIDAFRNMPKKQREAVAVLLGLIP